MVLQAVIAAQRKISSRVRRVQPSMKHKKGLRAPSSLSFFPRSSGTAEMELSAHQLPWEIKEPGDSATHWLGQYHQIILELLKLRAALSKGLVTWSLGLRACQVSSSHAITCRKHRNLVNEYELVY